MTEGSFSMTAADGLWRNNPALVQLLGLCPLLAVSTSVVNGLGLGLATLAVLLCSSTLVSLLRNAVPDSIRLPLFVLIIAAAVTASELLMQAFAWELHQALGIFLPLIATNCMILGRAEAFARRHAPVLAAWDALMNGLGFLLVLVLLGAVRELVGNGTLFSNMSLLFGPLAAHWEVRPFPGQPQMLVAVLPPGAFLFAGLLIAWRNAMDGWVRSRAGTPREAPEPGSQRVRITGNIQ
jgi:Na+-translocating ferredoxin:NAD+ oxidoreductase subunit E